MTAVKEELTFHYEAPFLLESGEVLPGFQLKYNTFGKLNADRSNVVWVCHALTGSADVSSWWNFLIDSGSYFDSKKYFIICVNTLGGCYGSTGPLSVNPNSRKPWFHSFPLITNRDVVRAFDLLRQHLALDSIHTLIGGSLGGQHVLEWALLAPDVFRYIIPIACNAQHSPWGIAFNEAQRMAISTDASWNTEDARAGMDGLKAARAIGMLSYRHYDGYHESQRERSSDTVDHFRASSYQQYQGHKLALRFNAFTYWTLSKMMDSHHIGRGRGEVVEVLKKIKAQTLVIGIDSDILFPVREQQLLATAIPRAELVIIQSLYGHDGFLVEAAQVNGALQQFFSKKLSNQLA